MTQRCGTCAHAQDVFGETGPFDELEDPLSCEWVPPKLPDSWVYVRREVIGMTAAEGTRCPCWKPIKSEEKVMSLKTQRLCHHCLYVAEDGEMIPYAEPENNWHSVRCPECSIDDSTELQGEGIDLLFELAAGTVVTERRTKALEILKDLIVEQYE